jgi:hypothetical protein
MANSFYTSSTKAAPVRFTGSALDRAATTGLAGSSFARPASSPQRPPSMPAMPSTPGGKLVPGRSGGSMVWQPDAPALPPAAPGLPPLSPSSTPTPAGTNNGLQGMNPLTGDSLNSGQRVDTTGLQGDNPLTGESLNAPKQPNFDALGLGKPLEFGGAFANGGIAPGGKVSLVGERGPEFIVPTGPTAVVPLPTRAAPMPPPEMNRSSLDQMDYQQFAMQRRADADKQWDAYRANTDAKAGPAMFDQWEAAAQVARNAQQDADNVPMPVQSARIVNTGSAMDRHMSTGLAGSPRRQVGRSANDPMRIAEQMRRRGDPSAILRFGAMQMGQQFAAQQDAANFQQQQQMFGQQQQAMDARDARNFQQQQQMFGQQQQAMDARDARNFQQQQQLEAERRALMQAEQLRREQAGKIVGFETMPLPNGQGFVPIARRADGSMDMAGSYMPNRESNATGYQQVPGTNILMPTGEGANRLPLMQQQGVTEAPRPSPDFPGPMPAVPRLVPYDPSGGNNIPAPQVRSFDQPDGTKVSLQWNPQTGQWEPVKMPGQQPSTASTMQSAAATQGKSARGATWSLAMP